MPGKTESDEVTMLRQLVSYNHFLDQSINYIYVRHATFILDFGPWKKGYIADTLELNYALGMLIERDFSGVFVREAKVFLRDK